MRQEGSQLRTRSRRCLAAARQRHLTAATRVCRLDLLPTGTRLVLIKTQQTDQRKTRQETEQLKENVRSDASRGACVCARGVRATSNEGQRARPRMLLPITLLRAACQRLARAAPRRGASPARTHRRAAAGRGLRARARAQRAGGCELRQTLPCGGGGAPSRARR